MRNINKIVGIEFVFINLSLNIIVCLVIHSISNMVTNIIWWHKRYKMRCTSMITINLNSWGLSCRSCQSTAECWQSWWLPTTSCRSPAGASQQTRGIWTWYRQSAFHTFQNTLFLKTVYCSNFTSFYPHSHCFGWYVQNGYKIQKDSFHLEVDLTEFSWPCCFTDPLEMNWWIITIFTANY